MNRDNLTDNQSIPFSEFASNNLKSKNQHTLDTKNTYRELMSMTKAIKERDFSKRVDPWFKFRKQKPYPKCNLEALLEHNLQQGKRIRHIEYAKVLAGQQTFGQYLTSSQGYAVRHNLRNRTLLSSLIAFNGSKIKYPRRCKGYFNLALLLKYANNSEPEFFESLELENLAWYHNAIHFILSGSLYTSLNQDLTWDDEPGKINADLFILAILNIFYLSNKEFGDIAYSYVRNPRMNSMHDLAVFSDEKRELLNSLSDKIINLTKGYYPKLSFEFTEYLEHVALKLRNIEVTYLKELSPRN